MSLIYIPPVQLTGHAVRSPRSPRGSAQRYLLDSPTGTPDAPFKMPPQHGMRAATKSRRRLFTTETDPVVQTEGQSADTAQAMESRRRQHGCGLWRCFARLFRRRPRKVRHEDGDQQQGLTASLDGVVVIAP